MHEIVFVFDSRQDATAVHNRAYRAGYASTFVAPKMSLWNDNRYRVRIDMTDIDPSVAFRELADIYDLAIYGRIGE